jgi:excisionase family DNA binding protein
MPENMFDDALMDELRHPRISVDGMDELRSNPTISVESYARVMGVSRGYAYNLAKVGGIPVIRVGRRLRIPSAAVLRMLEAEG